MRVDEFKPIANKLRIAFKKYKLLEDSNSFRLWYDILWGYDPYYLDMAADNLIRSITREPLIGDLVSEYDKLNKDNKGRLQR